MQYKYVIKFEKKEDDHRKEMLLKQCHHPLVIMTTYINFRIPFNLN